ncbi:MULTISPECIES: GAF domain-containing protein [Pseudomonas syringae group]|uniref:GAF domain-containing protein n=3 Tax=Pseudomonas syringae group TaxID=136849 RepID=A0A0P9LK14_PSECA|nr:MULTISPECIES: GAF domain-containing protein [Pseudomonas syringae group]KAA8697218.1 GAF domain-containing protein [Pseudomonas cannabina]KPB75576.1 GAF-like protein domain-containing protein [Pseudomonas syringae pv. maculicola]KPW16380.1 GAF domain-containing protein [Pseudomonas cannabina pv. alisalensis]KPW78184.1 GAF domain-containing protein [Pseudomonas cannabina]MBM0141059.1 GAF domain-containing protein [Pseudomonas cannabina pv. alisalensis]
MNSNLTSAELAVISEIEATTSLLRLVTRLTKLRFAAIAKVTDSSWTACAVYDEINFGLEAGHELKLETTLCNELRQHRQPIIINELATDSVYAEHPVPKLYGFQSYFSLPIIFPNGDFFGTLCGLDTLPAQLDDDDTLDTLKVFCTLIASTLYAHYQLQEIQETTA